MINKLELDIISEAERIIRKTKKNVNVANGLSEIERKYREVHRKLTFKPSYIPEDELRSLRMQGLSIKDISEKLKVSDTQVTKMINLHKLRGIGGQQKFNPSETYKKEIT